MLGNDLGPLRVQGFMLEQSKLNVPGLINQTDPERFDTKRTTETMLGMIDLQLGNK